jgi:hypothetical protein
MVIEYSFTKNVRVSYYIIPITDTSILSLSRFLISVSYSIVINNAYNINVEIFVNNDNII